MRRKTFLIFISCICFSFINCSSVTMKLDESDLSIDFIRYKLTKKPGLFSKTELEFKNYYAHDCNFSSRNVSVSQNKNIFKGTTIEETQVNKTYKYTFTNKDSKQQWDVLIEEKGQSHKEFEKEKDGEIIYDENDDFEFYLTVNDKQTKEQFFKINFTKNEESFYGFTRISSNNNVTGSLILSDQTIIKIIPTNKVNEYSTTYAFATGFLFKVKDMTVAGMDVFDKGGFILRKDIDANLIDSIAIISSALYFISQGGASVTTVKGKSIFN